MDERSCCCASPSAFSVVCVLDFSHSIGITLFVYLHCPDSKHMRICHLSIVFGEGSVTLREHLKLSALRSPSGTGSAIRVRDPCEYTWYMCAGPVWTHKLYVCRTCVNTQPHTEKALLSLPWSSSHFFEQRPPVFHFVLDPTNGSAGPTQWLLFIWPGDHLVTEVFNPSGASRVRNLCSRERLLNLSTTNTLEWMILCGGGCPVHYGLFSSILAFTH